MHFFIILASSEFQRYVIRKLTDIGFQISSLEEQGKVTNSRLNTIIQHLQTAYSHEAESEPVLQDVMNNFPIDNIEDLNKFEKLLMESQINRQKLVSTAKIKIIYMYVLANISYILFLNSYR